MSPFPYPLSDFALKYRSDVANWRYSELPGIFTCDKKPETYVVRTGKELQQVFEGPYPGLVFVEAILDKFDSPIDLIRGGHAFAETDYGRRGPQSKPDSQMLLPKESSESTTRGYRWAASE